MYKKLETDNLDIPKDDIDCWNRYPKHRWVYDLSRLYDIQHIDWSPFESDLLKDKVPSMYFISAQNLKYEPAHIYINKPVGNSTLAEAYITKGEIKQSRYLDKQSFTEIADDMGNIELRVNAFVSMHFQKFTGVLSIEFVGTHIVSVRLRANPELEQLYVTDVSKIVKKIYKKADLTFSGPADQVIQETLTS